MGYFDPSPPSITPTLGAQLLTNGDFETGDPPTGWTAENATLAQVLDGGSNRLKVTTLANWGNGYQSGARTSGWYRLSGQARRVSGTGLAHARFEVGAASKVTNYISSPSFSPIALTIRVGAGTGKLSAASNTSGDECRFDDFFLKQIVLASMLGSVQDMGGENVTLQVNLTMPSFYRPEAGLAFGIDDADSPQNLVAVYLQKDYNTVYISQLVAGVWTDLQVTSGITYVADAPLKAKKLNNQITVWYNGALVGSANVPCTANPYTKHSLLATDVSVTFADFTIAGGVYAVDVEEAVTAAEACAAFLSLVGLISESASAMDVLVGQLFGAGKIAFVESHHGDVGVVERRAGLEHIEGG